MEIFPITLGKQFLCVIDWQKGDFDFLRGFEEFLGYNNSELSPSFAIELVHPNDIEIVSKIIKGIVNHSIHADVRNDLQYLNISFRLRKIDGSYIRILMQSTPFGFNKEGNLIRTLTLLTDIHFIDKSEKVSWELQSITIDRNTFRQKIYADTHNLFTKRELEIIGLIIQGLTNLEIAKRLFISFHTVVAHRRNIYTKCKCHNAKELMLFIENNDIYIQIKDQMV